MAQPPLINIKEIFKRYSLGEQQFSALNGVSFQVRAGAFIAIRGPSGSGKSTLLNICGLLDGFDSGSYHLGGRNIGALNEQQKTLFRRKYIGFVFQSYNLVPVMSVRDNVEYPLLLAGLSTAKRQQKVDTILDQVGLLEKADRRPDQLSGGQRQRVAIARALIKRPKLVIADEPTANLDTTTATQIIDLMKTLGKEHKATFVIATHDDRMTSQCDAVRTMTDGVLQ